MTSPWIENVTEADFDEKVVAASKTVPVLVDFWAPWCGPCRMLGPILERVVHSYKGKIRLTKLNTDENPSLAARFGIQGIPAVKAFVDGRVADEFVGALPELQVREFIETLIPSEADLLAQKAKEMETALPNDALKLYQEALKLEPQHPPSLIGKLRVLIVLNRIDEAEDLYNAFPGALQYREEVPRLKALLDLAVIRKSGPPLAELSARSEKEPDNLEARWDLATRLAAEGNYPEALENYLIIVKKDRKFKDDGARKEILTLFEVIGPRSALAEQYREKLAQVLF
jgi:putative thioredoxin